MEGWGEKREGREGEGGKAVTEGKGRRGENAGKEEWREREVAWNLCNALAGILAVKHEELGI